MIAVLLSALLLAPDASATNSQAPSQVNTNQEAPKKQRKVCKVDEEDTFSKIRRRVCKMEDDRSSSGGSPSDAS
jgi:hypothetical protein